MSTTSIQQNVIYGLGEGALVADSTMLAYALRWANAAYSEIRNKPKMPVFDVRTIFRTADGQQTYQTPGDFIGFLTLKDEEAQNIIEQVTPEEYARRASTTKIDDESWTSDEDVAVALANTGIVQYSETVTNTAGTTTYTRDTDYTMDYVAGTITEDSGGSMSDATAYYIDYIHYETQKPSKFCIEYDRTNERFVIRMEPTPDDIYIISMLYTARPADLSGSVDPLWNAYEHALERGGIYYGSLELTEDAQRRAEFKALYDTAVGDVIRLQLDMKPKRDRIRINMRRQDYYDRQTGIWDDA